MTRSQRFNQVIRISEDREHKAARDLGESRQQLAAQQQRLSELQQYRDDYYRQYEQAGSQGISAAKLQELQRFLASLTRAIEQQKHVVSLAENNCSEKEGRWQQARSKTLALDKAAERLREGERLEQERREQKECDEFAQRCTPKHL